MNYSTSYPTYPCEIMNSSGFSNGCITVSGTLDTFTMLANFLFSVLFPIILVGGFTYFMYLRRRMCPPEDVPIMARSRITCDKLPEGTENVCQVCYLTLFEDCENKYRCSDLEESKQIPTMIVERSTSLSNLPLTTEDTEQTFLPTQEVSTAISYKLNAPLNTDCTDEINSIMVYIPERIESLAERVPIEAPINTESGNKKVVMLSCKHVYHETCIETWARYNPNCPICRFPVTFASNAT